MHSRLSRSRRTIAFIASMIGMLAIQGRAFAQEALLSSTEDYYDFLALNGSLERPYLTYRTLSDSDWDVSGLGAHPWAGNNLGTKRVVSDNFAFRIYGPELFSSFNSAAPYGQNDGALWQGRGLNASLSAGARAELTFGDSRVELTFKPVVYGSQNLPFELVPPAYSDSESGGIYAGKASEYGYFGIKYIDAPQRFGDDPFGGFSWGDSEVRFSWKTLTAGFGTQSIWLGPAKINPIIMSNNAPPFPKADIGVRKTELTLPWLGWDLGYVEGRLVAGYLSESEWFDNDDSNDHNLLSLLTLSYAPSILPELTLFANRVYLSKFDSSGFPALGSLFFVNLGGGGAQDAWDQRASVGFDFLVPAGGIEVYGEAGINDYGPSLDGYIRYPFHTMVYSSGISKKFKVSVKHSIDWLFKFEWSNLEASQDGQIIGLSTFYSHYQIKQGYSNQGQWLGVNGTGGNYQNFSFEILHRKGVLDISIKRANPDVDYIYNKAKYSTDIPSTDIWLLQKDLKSMLSFEVSSIYYITHQLQLHTLIGINSIHNPTYIGFDWGKDNKIDNFIIQAGVKWMQ